VAFRGDLADRVEVTGDAEVAEDRVDRRIGGERQHLFQGEDSAVGEFAAARQQLRTRSSVQTEEAVEVDEDRQRRPRPTCHHRPFGTAGGQLVQRDPCPLTGRQSIAGVEPARAEQPVDLGLDPVRERGATDPVRRAGQDPSTFERGRDRQRVVPPAIGFRAVITGRAALGTSEFVPPPQHHGGAGDRQVPDRLDQLGLVPGVLVLDLVTCLQQQPDLRGPEHPGPIRLQRQQTIPQHRSALHQIGRHRLGELRAGRHPHRRRRRSVEPARTPLLERIHTPTQRRVDLTGQGRQRPNRVTQRPHTQSHRIVLEQLHQIGQGLDQSHHRPTIRLRSKVRYLVHAHNPTANMCSTQ
jgi:hypothetical protein